MGVDVGPVVAVCGLLFTVALNIGLFAFFNGRTNARLEAATAAVQALASRIATVEATSAASAVLEQRISAAEKRLDRMDELPASVGRLQAVVEAMDRRMIDASARETAVLESLTRRLEQAVSDRS